MTHRGAATRPRAAAAMVCVCLLSVLVVAMSPAPAGASPIRDATRGTAGGVAAPPGAGCAASPFTAGFASHVAARWPGRNITASLYDSRTGCEYEYRPGLRITTASVLKIEIMAGVLLRAQRAGRGLTAWERAQIGPMISRSADPEASALWSSLGGTAGMAALERELGLTATTAASPWGLTSTTAADRTRLLRLLLLGEGGPFSASSRATAREFMLGVVPEQRWGVPTGVPTSWPVPLKNGFFSSRCCRWRINTSGVVERPDGTRYALTVLSDGWTSDRPGIELVNFVSQVVALSAAAPVGPFAGAAPAVTQQYDDVLGRAPTFTESYLRSIAVGGSMERLVDSATDLVGGTEADRLAGLVVRLYLGSLGRLPDPPTLRYRVWQLRSGRTTPTALAAALAASPQFPGGPTQPDPAFVDATVQAALGRLPSAASRAAWVSQLQAGLSRGALVLHFADSSEARRVRRNAVLVAVVHLSMLERAPSASSTQVWSDRLAAGTPLRSLVRLVLTSGEYSRRIAG